MEKQFGNLINFIKRIILGLLPLFLAFLSEIDVLVASIHGAHFRTSYVLVRLLIAVIVLSAANRSIKVLGRGKANRRGIDNEGC